MPAYRASRCDLNTWTFFFAIIARRTRRISSSLFPENITPQITSIQPDSGLVKNPSGLTADVLPHHGDAAYPTAGDLRPTGDDLHQTAADRFPDADDHRRDEGVLHAAVGDRRCSPDRGERRAGVRPSSFRSACR